MDELKMLDVRKCLPTENNPRAAIGPKDPYLLELKASLLARQTAGLPPLIHPILARPHPAKRECFEVLDGCCRLLAHQAASLGEIAAIVREMDDEQAFKTTLLGHFRKDLTPFEEAAGLIAYFTKGYSIAQIAAELGRPETWVRRRARLSNLAPAWRDALGISTAKNTKGKKVEEDDDPVQTMREQLRHTPLAALEAIARLDPEGQDELLDRFRWGCENVKVVEKAVADLARRLGQAPWSLDDETLAPAAGACAKCPKLASLAGTFLFDDEDPPPDEAKALRLDRCLSSVCWDAKRAAWAERRRAELSAEYPNLVVGTTLYGGDAPKGARSLSDMDGCKKTDLEALPVFVADGAAAGELKWMRLCAWARKRQDTDGGEEGASGKKTLKQKRAALDAKRWAQVLSELQALVQEGDIARIVHAKKRLAVIALAATFGTDEQLPSAFHDAKKHWREFEKLLNGPVDQPGADESVATQALWAAVRPLLARRLVYTGLITQTPSILIEEAKRIAELLQIDLDALFAEVSGRKGFREPKSWGQGPGVGGQEEKPEQPTSNIEQPTSNEGKKKRTAKSAKSAKKRKKK